MTGARRFILPVAVFVVVVAAILTIAGIVESGAILGTAILLAVAVISFDLGVRYRDIKRGS